MAGKADILLTARIVDEHGKEITDTYIRDNILTKLNKHTNDPLVRKTVPLSDALNAAEKGPKGNIKTTKYHREKLDEYAKRVAKNQATVVAEEADKANEAVSSSFEGMIDVVQQSVQAYLKSMTEAAGEVTEAVKEQVKETTKAVSDAQKNVVKNATGKNPTGKSGGKGSSKKTGDTKNKTPKDTKPPETPEEGKKPEGDKKPEGKPKTNVERVNKPKNPNPEPAAEPTDTGGKKDEGEKNTPPTPNVPEKTTPKKDTKPANKGKGNKKDSDGNNKNPTGNKNPTKPKQPTQPQTPTTQPADTNGAPTNTQQSKSSSQDDNKPLTKEELEDVIEELEDDQLNFKPWYPKWLIDLIDSITEKPAPQHNLEPMEKDWSKYEDHSDAITGAIASSIQSIGRVALTAINNITHTVFSKFKQGANTVTNFITNSVKKVFLAPSKELLRSFATVLRMAINASQIVQSIINIAIVPFVLMLEYLLVPVIKVIIPYVTKLVKFISDNKDKLLKLGEGVAKFFDVILSAGFDTLTKSKDVFKSPISTLLDVMTSMIDAAGIWMKDNAFKIFKALESIIISGIEFLSSSAKLSAYIFRAFLTVISSVFSASNSEFIKKSVAVIGGAFANIVTSTWTLIQTNPQIKHAVQGFANLITTTLLIALLDAVSLMEIPVVSWLAGLGSEKLNNYMKETTDWTSSMAYWDIAKQATDMEMARLSTQMNNTTNNNSQIWYISNGAGLGTKDSLLLSGAKYV